MWNDSRRLPRGSPKSGPAPTQPYRSHTLQLAAYCLLIEETYRQRPKYGIVKYADRMFAVDYTEALETELLDVIARMRAPGSIRRMAAIAADALAQRQFDAQGREIVDDDGWHASRQELDRIGIDALISKKLSTFNRAPSPRRAPQENSPGRTSIWP